jgi:hypothetical protein
LLTNLFRMALGATDRRARLFLNRHPFFEDVVAPAAKIFIGRHLDLLF